MRRKRGNTTNTAAKALATFGALAALVGGGVAMSGCGASATLDPIARAAEVTSQQSGAKISMTIKVSGAALPGGSDIAITADGYVDERDHSGELNMDLSGIPGFSAVAGSGGTIQMIFQSPVIYMNMPFLAGKLPEGKTWMKIDISKIAQSAGIDTSQLSSLGQNDPTQFLEYLRASSGAVVKLGSETLDGVLTTHYSATLQLSRILDQLPSDEQASAKAALEKLGSSGTFPVDVWVDAQGRVRRMQMSLSGLGGSTGAAAAGVAGIGGSITIDFKSYGAVPPIVPPPASQVFDASALTAAGIKSGGGSS
jgi:hypothetical protein